MATIDPLQFLLLLPPGPTRPTAQALKVAFGDSLTQVLKEVGGHSSKSRRATVLEIALALPHLLDCDRTPRTSLYGLIQSYLAAVYKLICTVAAKNSINVEDADGIDVRILLVGWSEGQRIDGPSVTHKKPYGPVISLQMLAQSRRPWQTVFALESETGGAMVDDFIALKEYGQEVRRIISGSVMQSGNLNEKSTAQEEFGSRTAQAHPIHALHPHVAVGGTFDHIHIGHKLLLTMTVFAVDEDHKNGRKERSATIGITGDQLLKNKKHAEVLESWQDRHESVMAFMNAIIDFSSLEDKDKRHVSKRDNPGPNGKSIDTTYPNELTVKCTEIQDPFGPTITEQNISALIVSAETRAGGKAVNDKRTEKNWQPLDIFEVDVLDAEEDDNDGQQVKEGFDSKLSSTAIREKLAKKRGSSL